MRTWLIPVLLPLCLVTTAAAGEWKNWFDDPFFQPRNGQTACQPPIGPLMTQAQRNGEAHYRVERGTSCWLAGKCSQPNAYWYDAGIGKAAARAFADTADFGDTSLWVTVQRRFVIVQGCIARPEQERQIEALLAPLPDVEKVILELMKPGDATPPYALAPVDANGNK